MEYAVKLQDAIATMLEDDESMTQELAEGENATAFFHALSTIMPCNMYNKMTGNDEDVLGYNHITNRLCFQFSKKGE